ncbi:hypothetical protein AKJ61_03150 [candidate division MSBL1 archaeon SCGC-AAA259B11]|uniref:Electron transfer flavoprotein alpha/beta-subunit N-terminal domain-containing protein n=1 Tax=candidate division MSBL1 archaeon SCGC-AAA259B11 TaxID=1698260 RepID=A0A133U532_9EURY|nr:hypothetical protein AKJ61_03150 [candidate division MSBL1 archaeon SCGC-AAA259B11]
MNIAVCVKDSPASMEDVAVTEGGQLDDKYLSYNINEWDSSALEAAVQLKEEHDGKIHVINISPRKNEKLLRKCLARGADEAILIQAEAFEKNDPQTSARILADVLKEMDLDIILTGLQSDDIGHSIVGGTLAQLLDLPFAPFVCDIKYDEDTNKATVKQLLEAGVEREIRIDTPTVLAVETRIAEPQPPTMMAIRKTEGQEIHKRTLQDLDLTEEVVGEKGAETKIKKYKKSPPPEAAEILEGSPKEVSQKIVHILSKKGLR